MRSDEPAPASACVTPTGRTMDAERWERLLRVAAAEFALHGFEHASLNRVIRELGMSKSSFYYVVPSKEALFEAVHEHFVPRLARRLALPTPAELAEDYWGGLEGLVERLIAATLQDPVLIHVGRMWHAQAGHGPPGGGGVAGRDQARVAGWLHQVVELGRAHGVVRTDLPVGLQVRMVVALAQVFDEWFLTDPPADIEQASSLARVQLSTLRRACEPDPTFSDREEAG